MQLPEGERRFRFAQFEFPWALGPDDGRYVVRERPDDQPRHILVLSTLGAPERRFLARRRGREAAPEPPPAPVTTTRATVVDAEPVSEDEAGVWLSRLDDEGRLDEAARALAVLNVAIRAQRLATADPAVHDVTREHALVVRLGYGRGPQVADGHWTAATEVAADTRRRRRRLAALRPHERLAALLGGHESVLACEELTLRARADLDAGRDREAALQLRVALEAAISELGGLRHPADMADRVEGLRAQREAIGAAANQALLGPLPPASLEPVAESLKRLEAAVRAHAAAGPETHRAGRAAGGG